MEHGHVALRLNTLALNTLGLRVTLPVAVAGLTALGIAVPAQAAPLETPVELSVPDRVVTTQGGSKTVPFEVVNTSEVATTGLVVDFTAAPAIGFKPPEGCTVTGCAVGGLAPGARKSYTFTVTPTAALPTVGAALGLSVHDADKKWEVKSTVTVVRAALGIDLETAPIPDFKLDPGKSVPLPLQVRNNGDKAAAGVALALSGQPYISFPNNYANCTAVKEITGIICVFEDGLEPGAAFGLSTTTPLVAAADKATPGPADYSLGLHAYGLEGDEQKAGIAAARKAAKKPGTRLELVPVARTLAAVDSSELNEWDNAVSFRAQVGLNQADSVAIGDDFEGKVGATRTIKVGFRNDGPAALLGPSKTWSHTAKVRIPSGLKLTKVDKGCVPNADGEPSWDNPGQISGHDYVCKASAGLKVGAQQLFSFTAKIEDGRNEDEGSITVNGGVQDPKKANNVAKIQVKVPTAGSGGGTGGGGLPITGTPTGTIAGSGLLLVLAGAFALFLTRRRPVA
jgi:hypothetical protein